MAKPDSDDLRERVVADIEAGFTREEVAELYKLALSTVGGFIKRKRDTGSVSSAKFGGHKTFARTPHTDLVKALVAEQPDSTLAELQGNGKDRSQVCAFAFLSGTLSKLAKVPKGSRIEHIGLRFFCVQTILFETLYVFFVIRHANREVVHVGVTRYHPTAEWAAQQIVECCACDRWPPRFLIHDRDGRYGIACGVSE